MSLTDYIESHTTAPDHVLDAVERWAHLHTAQPQMICGPYVGSLLTILCRACNAHAALEIGSFVGYSTICIARGLAPDGTLHAFEINEEYEAPIRRHLDMAGVGEKVSLHSADATQSLSIHNSHFTIHQNSIDFAFIDADKRSNALLFDPIVPLLRPGGLLLVDNVLWGGKVLDPVTHHDIDTRLIRDFNDKLHADPRVQNIMLPLRDGLSLSIKL